MDMQQRLDAYKDAVDTAMGNNRTEEFVGLLNDPEFGPTFFEVYLCAAVESDSIEPLNLLLGLEIPIHGGCQRALWIAVQHDRMEHVQRLLEVLPAPLDTHMTLETAALYNNIAMVRCLLPHCNPKDDNSICLKWASYHGNQEMFDLLYPLSDAVACKKLMDKSENDDQRQRLLVERMESERLHGALEQVVHTGASSRVKKL